MCAGRNRRLLLKSVSVKKFLGIVTKYNTTRIHATKGPMLSILRMRLRKSNNDPEPNNSEYNGPALMDKHSMLTTGDGCIQSRTKSRAANFKRTNWCHRLRTENDRRQHARLKSFTV